MNLKQIKEKECPGCGSRTVAETRNKKHTNGYWNESRTFQCGCKIEFSPNFMKTTISELNQCPYKPEQLEKKSKRDEALNKLIVYIKKTLKVDEVFKVEISRSIISTACTIK